MCILLKLHYAKFDVSGLLCSKVIEEKLLVLGSTPSPPPPLGKGRVKLYNAQKSSPIKVNFGKKLQSNVFTKGNFRIFLLVLFGFSKNVWPRKLQAN